MHGDQSHIPVEQYGREVGRRTSEEWNEKRKLHPVAVTVLRKDGANRAAIIAAIETFPGCDYKEIAMRSGVQSQIVRTQLTYFHDQEIVTRQGKKGQYRYTMRVK